MTNYQNLVNGKWKSSENEIAIYSPINQEILGTVPAMSQAEVDEAMKSARAALPAWRDLAPVERAAYLHKTADILERDKTSLDLFWIKDKSLADLDNLPDPDELAVDIIENLQSALESFQELQAQLKKC